VVSNNLASWYLLVILDSPAAVKLLLTISQLNWTMNSEQSVEEADPLELAIFRELIIAVE